MNLYTLCNKWKLFPITTGIIGILALTGCQNKREQDKKPNIIVILSDDAGYADFGFTEGNEFPTPNIDSLAADGVVCTQGYVTASTCAPSRAGLMTGKYQQRFGAECNVPTIPTPGHTEEDLGVDTSLTTYADRMNDLGYRTMAVGKWHLGELPQYHPNNRGFDEFYGFTGGARSYWPVEDPEGDRAMLHNMDSLNEMEKIDYLTDDLTDATLDFINRNQDKPFFVYLAYNAVHTPFHAKDEDIEQSPSFDNKYRRILAAMTRSLDENVGKLREKLRELDLAENTLIFFLNDNGGATAQDAYSNGSLRGYKGSYWEGGIRVPFVVSWPAQLPGGKTFDHPVSALDLMPTSISAAGGKVSPDEGLDGVNLMPHLKGENDNPPHDILFWRFWRVSAVRQGQWKLIRVAENPLKEDRELILPLMLINLEKDPAETTNVAKKHPEKTRELLNALEEWEQGLEKPRWYDGSRWKHWQEVKVDMHRMEQ
jgi:arylsulfatase A-like enzyme